MVPYVLLRHGNARVLSRNRGNPSTRRVRMRPAAVPMPVVSLLVLVAGPSTSSSVLRGAQATATDVHARSQQLMRRREEERHSVVIMSDGEFEDEFQTNSVTSTLKNTRQAGTLVRHVGVGPGADVTAADQPHAVAANPARSGRQGERRSMVVTGSGDIEEAAFATPIPVAGEDSLDTLVGKVGMASFSEQAPAAPAPPSAVPAAGGLASPAAPVVAAPSVVASVPKAVDPTNAPASAGSTSAPVVGGAASSVAGKIGTTLAPEAGTTVAYLSTTASGEAAPGVFSNLQSLLITIGIPAALAMAFACVWHMNKDRRSTQQVGRTADQSSAQAASPRRSYRQSMIDTQRTRKSMKVESDLDKSQESGTLSSLTKSSGYRSRRAGSRSRSTLSEPSHAQPTGSGDVFGVPEFVPAPAPEATPTFDATGLATHSLTTDDDSDTASENCARPQVSTTFSSEAKPARSSRKSAYLARRQHCLNELKAIRDEDTATGVAPAVSDGHSQVDASHQDERDD